MKSTRNKEREEYQRILVILPKPLVGELQRYVKFFRNGNQSGFIADAIKEKIDHLHKLHHTAKMRESYRASAQENRRIAHEWRYADADMDRLLDKRESI